MVYTSPKKKNKETKNKMTREWSEVRQATIPRFLGQRMTNWSTVSLPDMEV
jgi:hypothetical protein